MAGYTTHSAYDRDVQVVAITSVDPLAGVAVGLTRQGTSLQIDVHYHVGAVELTPARGEQWYVERCAGTWRLQSRLPFNDPKLLTEPVEGQVRLGSTGPLELNGSALVARAPLVLPASGAVAAPGALARAAGGRPVWSDGTEWRDTHWGSPYDVHVVHTQAAREAGYGPGLGVRLPRACLFTSVHYRCGTADASGNTVVELRRNGAAVAGTSVSLAAAAQVAGSGAAGSWAFAAGDVVAAYVSAVGATPGSGLVAEVAGVTA